MICYLFNTLLTQSKSGHQVSGRHDVMLVGIDHLERRALVGRAADRPAAAAAVVLESDRRNGGRGHGARVVGGHARPQSVRVWWPRERRVRVRHLVQPVTGGAGELGGCPFRRPVPQYPVDATHRRRRTVRAYTCEHAYIPSI